jgi:hypothetical protein
MFGGMLRNLFSKGGGKAASRLASEYGDDALRAVANSYGDDVLRAVTASSGDDIAKSALSQLGDTITSPAPSVAPSPKLIPAVDDIADDVILTTPKKSKLGDALVEASEVGLNAPLSLTRKDLRDIGKGSQNKIGELFDRTGMSSIDDLRELGEQLTGAGEKSFMDQVTNHMRTNGGNGNLVDLNDIKATIRDLKGELPKTLQSRISEEDPVGMANMFRGTAADMRKSATKTTGQEELAKVFDNIGRDIDARIDANVDPKYVSQAYNDTVDEFLTRSRENLLNGNKKMSEAYKRLAKEISEIPEDERTIGNYRAFKKDFVDIGKIAGKNDQSKGGGAFSRTVSQLPVVGKLADSLLSTPVERASQKVGEVMRKVGQSFQRGEAQELLKNGAAIGGGGLALASLFNNNKGASALTNQDDSTTSMNSSALQQSSSTLPSQPSTSALGSLFGPNTGKEEPTVGGYTRSQLEDGYVKALMNGDTKSASAMASIMDIMNNNEKRAMSMQKAGQQSGGTDAKKAAGAKTLQTLLGSFNSGGGAQGAVGGTLTNLLNGVSGGAFNPSAQAYASQSRGAAAQIIKALGDSGTLSDRDVQSAMDMLPKNTDSKKTAQEKVSNLMALLRS